MKKVDFCTDCGDCTKRAPYFQTLSDKEIDILNRDRFSVRYKAGEMILKQGTHATHILSLVGGIVKMYIEGIDDRNLLLDIMSPWKLIADPGVYTDNKIHYSVSALTDATICYIDTRNFREIINNNPLFASQLISHISERALNMFQLVISLTQKQMHGRMADGLLYLSNRFYKSDTFTLHLSRQDLGDLTAMSKDSAIRILKEFERDGVISVNGKELKILAPVQLKEISEKG